MPTSYNLTIYLINRDLEHDAIISDIRSRQYRNFDIGRFRYHIFGKRKREQLPHWEPFFEGHLDNRLVWPTSAPGLVVLIDVEGRTFALTFGRGKPLLVPDCWEDRFGLKVVLNTIEKVKSISKKSFDTIQGKTQTDANDFTDVDQFGFDVEKDLLRAVTGKPTDERAFGHRLTGADALVATLDVDLRSLPELLSTFLAQSQLEIYREKFSFVDHLRAVEGSTLKNQLEANLVDQLRTRIEELERHNPRPDFSFEVIIPQVLDWGRVSHFGYGSNRLRNPERQDITIDTFLAYLSGKSRLPISIDSLKRSHILALDGDGIEVDRWTGYRCLTGEVQIQEKRFILSDRQWYQVSSDYVEELDRFINQIPRYPVRLPAYTGGRERQYNERVAIDLAGFYCLDGGMIRPMTNQQVEYCDIYSETQDARRDLIHVKHGTSSAVLSHLFSQGTTSAELYSVFDECRDQADMLVRKAMGDEAFDREDRPVRIRTVYAIIRSRAGSLPFFSKVNLKRACHDLRRSSIEYAIAEIVYAPEYRIAK